MTELLQPVQSAQAGRWFRSGATIASAVLIFSLLVFACLFPSQVAAAVRVWIIWPAFNHCFFVPLLAIFVIWQRRGTIEKTDLSPNMWGAVAVAALSFAWLIASFALGLEAEQFIIVTMVQGIIFGILGTQLYRKLAAPFLYLYFLVPTGTFLIPPLQAFTARFAVAGLHLLGIPVFSTGAVIEIPAGTFAIAEACAGLRFLIASVAFGVFFAIVTYKSVLRRALFIALSVIVPIVANGIRALALIAAAQWLGSPTAALADHVIYGWIFFSIVLIILVLIGHLFSDRSKTANGQLPSVERSRDRHMPLAKIASAAVLSIIGVLPDKLAAAVLSAPQALPLPQGAPRVSPPWELSNAQIDWKPILIHPSRAFSDTFVLGRTKVDRYMALYAGDSRTSNLVRSANREADEKVWTFDSASSGELTNGRQRIPVRISSWLRSSERRRVWSFYVVGGKPVASSFRARIDQLLADLRGRKCLAGYVALSMEVPNATSFPTGPANLLAATEPLGSYLCSHSHAKSTRAASKSRP